MKVFPVVGMLLYFLATGDRTGTTDKPKDVAMVRPCLLRLISCHAVHIFCVGGGGKKSSIVGNWNGKYMHDIDYSFIFSAIGCLPNEK